MKIDVDSVMVAGRPSRAERDAVVRDLLPLVRAIAGRIAAGLPSGVMVDDLVGAGAVGLLDAVDRYDPGKGLAFRKYAAIRIRGSILDELRASDWASRAVRKDQARVESVRRDLETRTGRQVSSQEAARQTAESPETLARLMSRLARKPVVFLEDITGDDESHGPAGAVTAATEPGPDDETETTDVRRYLLEAVSQLAGKASSVIYMYYFERLSLKEIGQVFEITESRVSQIHSQAIEALRKKVNLSRGLG